MPEYRRYRQPGGSYFFTLTLADRHQSLLIDQIDLLRQSFARVENQHSFQIDAIVVLPEHLHCIMTFTENDHDYSTRWRLIKTYFSRGIKATEQLSSSRINKAERGIWQRRFWEHLIRNQDDMNRHVDYIHFNPVKHGYVERPVDWEYSSIHRYIAKGIMDENWGTGEYKIDMDLG